MLELHDSVSVSRACRRNRRRRSPTASRRRSSTPASSSATGRRLPKLGVANITRARRISLDVQLRRAGEHRRLQGSRTPQEPMVLHLVRTPCAPGKPRKEQHRLGREDLLTTTFETFEREIRSQLGRTLSEGGFDPARDIEAITVNRWPHGYTYNYNTLVRSGRVVAGHARRSRVCRRPATVRSDRDRQCRRRRQLAHRCSHRHGAPRGGRNRRDRARRNTCPGFEQQKSDGERP